MSTASAKNPTLTAACNVGRNFHKICSGRRIRSDTDLGPCQCECHEETMSSKYCPRCEKTTYNCECEPQCKACQTAKEKDNRLGRCAFCGARDVFYCRSQWGGCDGCEDCCTCRTKDEPEVCRACDRPFTDGHPECELDPGYHRGGTEGGHCCIESRNPTHWVCTSCRRHYEPRHSSDLCLECRDIETECERYGHDWHVQGDSSDMESDGLFHVHVDAECYECGIIGEICTDVQVQEL